ncbi:MAG: polysaccharide deacetylase family protein [Clostridia bacterium]
MTSRTLRVPIVANHSVNHPSLPGKNDLEVIEEILGLERRYYEAFGRNMKYFRAPMGEYSERVLAITWDLGYHSVFWSFAYRDWETDNQKGADHAYNEIMPYLHNGCVLLLHAVSQDNALALDRVIRDAKAQGYVFKTLDDLVESVYRP